MGLRLHFGGNGYANRFLFACVRRSKFLPDGGALATPCTNEQVEATLEASNAAQNVDLVTSILERGAGRVWESHLAGAEWMIERGYRDLPRDIPRARS